MIAHSSFAFSVGEPLGCCPDEQARALFSLGCLGPDVYFFDRLPPTPFIPHQKKHGNRLHNVPCDRLCRAMLSRADDALMPYVYGFLTHIALDSTMHPYICARYPHGLDHTRFEGDIDAALYPRFCSRYDFRHIFQCPKDIDKLDRFVTDVSHDVLGAGEHGAYKRGAKKLLRLYPLMFDPKGGKYRFLQFFERLLKKDGAVSGLLVAPPHAAFADCMNESRTPWRSPVHPNVERTETVDELIAAASVLAQKLIRAAMERDEETLMKLAANRTMENGVTA